MLGPGGASARWCRLQASPALVLVLLLPNRHARSAQSLKMCFFNSPCRRRGAAHPASPAWPHQCHCRLGRRGERPNRSHTAAGRHRQLQRQRRQRQRAGAEQRLTGPRGGHWTGATLASLCCRRTAVWLGSQALVCTQRAHPAAAAPAGAERTAGGQLSGRSRRSRRRRRRRRKHQRRTGAAGGRSRRRRRCGTDCHGLAVVRQACALCHGCTGHARAAGRSRGRERCWQC